MAESHLGGPDPLSPGSVYGEGKRVAEVMCMLAANPRLEIKIARCFAFVGPHLPLDTHFAVGNFLSDAMSGRDISIASDGRSVRSYLYASELMIWLWTMLFRAPSRRAYNVGSDQPVSIRELAETVRSVINPQIEVMLTSVSPSKAPATRYVPSVKRAAAELGLRQTVSLEDALRRTLRWHRLKSSEG